MANSLVLQAMNTKPPQLPELIASQLLTGVNLQAPPGVAG